jgi:uncharacterized membrane protein YjdF
VAGSLVGLVVLDALGDYLDWYATIVYFDSSLHFLLPAAAVAGFWQLRISLHLPVSYRYVVYTVAPCVIVLATLYEVEEYLEDILTGSQRLGDGFDTANDLLMGVLGAFAPIVIVYLYQKLRPHP